MRRVWWRRCELCPILRAVGGGAALSVGARSPSWSPGATNASASRVRAPGVLPTPKYRHRLELPPNVGVSAGRGSTPAGGYLPTRKYRRALWLLADDGTGFILPSGRVPPRRPLAAPFLLLPY